MPHNRARPWTADEEQLLLALHSHGLSLPRISSKLRRTTGAARGRLYALLREQERADDISQASRLTVPTDREVPLP